jgi:phosphoribosylformimino-5-aminoimidazole carboxamide ribonucleotide (ProFAR) isomerase
MERLKAVLQVLDNDKSKLVIDLSCRRKDDKWFVATNKWQTITDFELNQGKTTIFSVVTFTNTVQTLLAFLSRTVPSS